MASSEAVQPADRSGRRPRQASAVTPEWIRGQLKRLIRRQGAHGPLLLEQAPALLDLLCPAYLTTEDGRPLTPLRRAIAGHRRLKAIAEQAVGDELRYALLSVLGLTAESEMGSVRRRRELAGANVGRGIRAETWARHYEPKLVDHLSMKLYELIAR